MKRWKTLLPLWLLTAGVGPCTDGRAEVLLPSAALERGGAGAGPLAGAGGSVPRASAGGTGKAGSSGGAGKLGNLAGAGGGGRSELQAGSGGDRAEPACADPPDPTVAPSELEMLDALNQAIELKTFCGGALKRLTMDPGARCFARDQAHLQGDRGSRGFVRPFDPGWSTGKLVTDPDFLWFAKQADSTADAKALLLGGTDEGRNDHREDLCAAAQRGVPYKTAGVGRFHDTWVIIVSVY